MKKLTTKEIENILREAKRKWEGEIRHFVGWDDDWLSICVIAMRDLESLHKTKCNNSQKDKKKGFVIIEKDKRSKGNGNKFAYVEFCS